MDIYSIYKITNTINDKVYIGFSKDFATRVRKHKSDAKRGKFPLHKAIQKHGWENFLVEEICCGKNKEYMLQEMEPYFIKLYNSRDHGYNCTMGGEGHSGFKISEETRKKRSDAAKRQWANAEMRDRTVKGQITDNQREEKRNAISQKAKDRWNSEVFRTKMDQLYTDPIIRGNRKKSAEYRWSLVDK